MSWLITVIKELIFRITTPYTENEESIQVGGLHYSKEVADLVEPVACTCVYNVDISHAYYSSTDYEKIAREWELCVADLKRKRNPLWCGRLEYAFSGIKEKKMNPNRVLSEYKGKCLAENHLSPTVYYWTMEPHNAHTPVTWLSNSGVQVPAEYCADNKIVRVNRKTK